MAFDSFSLFSILLCAIVTYIVKVSIKRFIFVNKMKTIPGPPALPFLGNSLSLTGGQVEFFKILNLCHDQYGPIFCLWVGMQPFIFLANADDVQTVLSSSFHTKKSYEYTFLEPWLGSGILLTSGKKWQERRKFLTPAFHIKLFEGMIVAIEACAQLFVDKLQVHVNQDMFNMIPMAKLFSLDSVCETVMGKSLGVQLNGDNEYSSSVDKLNMLLQERFIQPWLKPDFIWKRTKMGKEAAHYVKVIHKFVDEVIAEKKSQFMERKLKTGVGESNKKPQLAFLDLLIEAVEGRGVITDKELRDEVNTFMFAGHDTIAYAISWACYLLGKHPEVQEKILHEYTTIVGNSALTFNLISSLKYTGRCIKEVLRLYPPVPLIARSITKPITLRNASLPAGVTLLINAYQLHRSSKTMDRPNVFNPDRFLKAPKKSFSYIPFSAGPRNCIGSEFAMMEMKIVLVSIVKNFVIKSPIPEKDLQLMSEILLTCKNGIQVAIEPRN